MPLSYDIHLGFWSGVVLGITGGFLIAVLTVFGVAVSFLRQNDIYDADHWKLNVKVPFTTMWMNMGYWTSSSGQPIVDFEHACRALLHEVVKASGILDNDATATSSKLAILDLGIGCGDQSLELARLIRKSDWNEYSYVGLTLNQTQFQLASSRIRQELEISGEARDVDSINVFQADAAKPEGWTSEIQSAIKSLKKDSDGGHERWVLGLDSLYHFFPSRKPILKYAAADLDANFMAFDLLLDESASFASRLTVKVISVAMRCPPNTFLTRKNYARQLQDAGYHKGHVQFRDVTEHVFSGLVSHINQQENVLKPYGISLAKYKIAGKLFAWFARSRSLRATIVLARKEGKII